MRFRGDNTTASMIWSVVGDITDTSPENTRAQISATGTLMKQPRRTIGVSASISCVHDAPNYELSAAGITVTMPPKAHVVTGHEVHLFCAAAGTITLTTPGAETTVNALANYNLTVTAFQTVVVLYNGTGWNAYK